MTMQAPGPCLHPSITFEEGGAVLACDACPERWLARFNVPATAAASLALTGAKRVDAERFAPTERPTANEGIPRVGS